MPRAIWSGSISFGLVNVPVKVFPAVKQQDLSFHQFQEGTNARIRYKRVSEKTGKEVPYEDIVKGYEVTKGQHVIIDPEELEAMQPEDTRTIDIEDFVDLAEIDPIYYERTYWLAPDGKAAAKPYALLLKAMEEKQKVGIGKVVMRSKQYLAAIRPLDGALAMSTMLFSDEVVPRSEVDGVKATGRPTDKEVKLAAQIVDSLSADWKPERYRDTYREQMLELIERKAKGEEIVVEEEAPEEPKVTDLMAALEASLESARKGKRATGGSSRPAGRSKESGSKSGRKTAARRGGARRAG
jgi:DNA end-binding protein Ku